MIKLCTCLARATDWTDCLSWYRTSDQKFVPSMSTFDGFIKELPDITGKYHVQAPELTSSWSLHSQAPSAQSACSVSFTCTQGPHERLGDFQFEFRLLFSGHKGSTARHLVGTDFELVLRLQTKRDRLHFAEGIIEKKIRTYVNLNYRKDLLVNPCSCFLNS